jgi:DNA-binding transcriptional LysR family regulator
MEFDNIETIKQAIAIAAGVSILPRPAVAKELGVRTLAGVPLAIDGLVRPIAIIHRRGRRLTPAVARFVEVLRQAGDAADGAALRARARGRRPAGADPGRRAGAAPGTERRA